MVGTSLDEQEQKIVPRATLCSMQQKIGHCACGAVSYRIEGEVGGVVSCHCKSCQRLHGNYNPMVVAEKDAVAITGDVTWYQSSDEAERGFCAQCGSALFKRQKKGSKILASVGSLDDVTGLTNIKNVFVEEAGAYYLMPPGE